MSIYNVTGIEKSSVPSYVTPEMFGAVGDGTTDDYTAIAAAITAAGASGQPLYFADKDYYSSQSIVVSDPTFDIIMDGCLKSAAAIALQIGDASASFRKRKLDLRVKSTVAGSSVVADSVGIKIINAFRCEIALQSRGFDAGCQLVGDGNGFSYNSVKLRLINDNLVGVSLCAINNGWVCENQYYGGNISCWTGFPQKGQSTGILLESGRLYNANTFFCPCLEGLNVGVNVETGTNNLFLYVRTEATTTPYTGSGDYKVFNVFVPSVGNYPPVERGFNTIQDLVDLYTASLNTLVFDSGFLPANSASNADGTATARACNGSFKVLGTTAGNVTVTKDYLQFAEGGTVGCVVDTSKQKEFLLRVNTADNTQYRACVVQFDSEGDEFYRAMWARHVSPTDRGGRITIGGMAGSADAGVGYVSKTLLTGDVLISFDADVKKAYIGVCDFSQETHLKLTRFQVYAKGLTDYFTMGNEDYPVLSAIPTNTGFKGQFVKNANPTASALGWVYNGTEWIAV